MAVLNNIDDKTTKEYKETILIGKYFADLGYNIKSGGYRGLMEAISIGAAQSENDVKIIGYTIGNSFLTETVVCDDIYDRLRKLITDTDVFIIQVGGIGTLAEMTLVFGEMRKKKVEEIPLIFVFIENWYDFLSKNRKLLGNKLFNHMIFVYDYDDIVGYMSS